MPFNWRMNKHKVAYPIQWDFINKKEQATGGKKRKKYTNRTEKKLLIIRVSAGGKKGKGY